MKLYNQRIWNIGDGVTLHKFQDYLLQNIFFFYVDHMALVYLIRKLQILGQIA
jgi:hypothetical protein